MRILIRSPRTQDQWINWRHEAGIACGLLWGIIGQEVEAEEDAHGCFQAPNDLSTT